MDFKEFFMRIFYGLMLIALLSGIWILMHWGFDSVTMENPPTLGESAQSFLDFWVTKFWAISGTREIFQ